MEYISIRLWLGQMFDSEIRDELTPTYDGLVHMYPWKLDKLIFLRWAGFGRS